MEIVAGWTHRAFPIDDDASRIGEARRHAAQLAAGLSFSEVDAGRVALVLTELGTNLLRHSRRGRLLIAARQGARDIELLAIDEGPGIVDVPMAMRDGQSSGSTPGTGLGAIRRLADEFDMHSTVPDGTVCVARVRAATPPGVRPKVATAVAIGAICLPAPGEIVCGDAWAAGCDAAGATLLVADGLGHGPEAAKASMAATAAFGRDPAATPRDMVQKAHLALQTTRGAALCALRVDAEASTLSYSGAGNVVGRVLSGVFDKSIVTQHGTAGLQIRRPEESSMTLPPHALVIVHTDGIDTRWRGDRLLPVLGKDPALAAAILLRDHTRHRDDATVVVVRRTEMSHAA
ncbi:ATP-binding protein/SpoIIE family protein phosphatase [Variovorax sp. J22P168]|uniref:ATP-binding SpoIIE family protein phosphatase n=1 Tax=Variovorax jilinensis TaxID=3053513 RepID=UPI00257604EF|nr:ATP-binding SpoIIE family protein phosphatase [Variovorax sp. J22P168]MDM0015399.1 ATP-binding protein/SpoIIE family protein phosphatase [Variovorax sp. J22P168]